MGLILDEQKWEQKYNSLIYSLNINIFSVTDTRIFVNVIFTDYKNLFLDYRKKKISTGFLYTAYCYNLEI